MSWTDEEIDNLFRDGANGQSFEYDNAYFSEIESALPVNGKGKDFLWMGTALVFIAVLTTGYLVNNANDTAFNADNNQLANVELNTTNDNATANASNESEISSGDQNESINNLEENGLNNEFSNLENASSNANSNSAASLKKNAASSNVTSSQNATSTEAHSKVDPNSMRSVANRNAGRSQNVILMNDQTGSTDGNTNQNGTQQGSTDENLAKIGNDAKVSDQKGFILQSAPITASLNVNGANQLDQGLSSTLAPNVFPIGLGPIRPKAALYFELNAGVSQSLITPSDVMSKSVGGGIGVETYLGDFNLTTGLNFKASYHDDLFLTRTGKVYGFGSNEGINDYDVQKIYSIEMPISLGYNFGRHNVNLGVRPSFVIGAQTQKHVFEEDKFLRTEQLNGLIEENINGENIAALMRFGVKPTVGYSYRINNWTIGANIGVQLMQSVNEDLINGFNNQFPVDGQIYLRRTIRLRK